MGLHICAVVQRGAGSPSEHVYSFPEGELAAGRPPRHPDGQ